MSGKLEQSAGSGSAALREVSSESAVYKQIEADMRLRIGQGQWSVGEMLPGRRDLARHYRVSPLTVERAVTGLIADGLLRADGRRGTFIARSNATEVESSRNSGSRSSSAGWATVAIVGRLFIGADSHLDLNNQWVRAIVHSIESTCAQDKNVTRFINQAGRKDGKIVTLPEAVEEACQSDADALAVISLGIDAAEVDEALDVYCRMAGNRPLVILSSSGRLGRPLAQVYYDNWGAGYEAVSHLIAAGCRRTLMFTPVTAPWAKERMAGAKAAAANGGLDDDWLVIRPEIPEPWQQYIDPVELGYRYARTVLDEELGKPWDGVLCIQDQGGYGFMEAASERGLTAGIDYAIMGFDDADHSRSVNMSTMRPPFERMGFEAAKLLRRELAGEPVNQQICLRWQLIARTSTAIRETRVAVHV